MGPVSILVNNAGVIGNTNLIEAISGSPGTVKTDIFKAAKADLDFSSFPHLKSEDIADAVLYTLSTPPHVQVHEIIIHPVGEE